MKILHDIHMHTKRCGHAVGEVSEYVETARRAGLEEIGFSDHMPLLDRRDPELTMDLPELPDYQRDIAEAAAVSKDVRIKTGIEADYLENLTDKTAELLSAFPYDYVIGSVHFIKEWGFDDPRQIQRWENEDVERVYRQYYRVLQASAKTGLFDIIGHADLVKKFGHRPDADLADVIDETAKVFADAGVSVEINTSGLRKPVGEIYPCLRDLKIYRSRGVSIVFGSDAHAPQEVGADMDKARDLALAAGFTEYLVYKQRKVEKTVKL